MTLSLHEKPEDVLCFGRAAIYNLHLQALCWWHVVTMYSSMHFAPNAWFDSSGPVSLGIISKAKVQSDCTAFRL